MGYAMNVEFLREMGLTEVEARVYLCLLQEGSLKAGLISKLLGIHRRSVYDAIDRLRKKGMVSYIKTNNVNHYEAAEPQRILGILKEKEKNLQSILPELEGLRKLSKEKKETLFFRGKASMKTIFNDQLDSIEEGGEVCVLAADVDVNEILKYYFPKFDARRRKKRIKIRMIMDSSAENKKILKQIPLCNIRFADFKSDAKVSTYVYGSHVSMIRWDEEPIAILIKEKEIANRFNDYFELLWKGGTKK
ncbi:TrmB family transcriptional regulator [Thermoproteota archaeon]